MFKINKSLFGHLESININNADKGIHLQIINSFGGVINQFQVSNSPFSFIQGYGDCEELITKNQFFSRSAKLFPFPNRLNQGLYHYQDTKYQLPANFKWSEHAVHGLLYNQPFFLVEEIADSDFAAVTIRFETDRLHDGYPFAFTLDITYRVEANGTLEVTTQVKNHSTQPIPIGDAWHPYFNLGTELSCCELTLPPCYVLEQVDDLPTGNKEHCDQFSAPASLQGISLNDCFEFKNHSSNSTMFSRSDSSASIEIELDENYRFLQLYTPASESTLAIEPMTCPADAFNNQIGLIHLEPNQMRSFTWQCRAQYIS